MGGEGRGREGRGAVGRIGEGEMRGGRGGTRTMVVGHQAIMFTAENS